MIIRIFESNPKYACPHVPRGSLAAPVLPVDVATPRLSVHRAGRGFYSLAAQSAQARETPAPGGSECIPATLSAFLDAWISPIPKEAIPRDFSFKAVIGEPSW